MVGVVIPIKNAIALNLAALKHIGKIKNETNLLRVFVNYYNV